MDDFERRLASRLSAYEQSVSVPDAPAATPAPRRRAWAAVAAVVVLAVGIGLIGSRLLSGVRPVGNGPVTSLTWTTHPFIAGARVVELKAVGTRLIATGGMAAADGTSADQPAAWYSDDGGVTWAASSVEAPSGGPEGAAHELARVVEHDGRLLALDAYTFGLATDLSSGASTLGGVTTAVWSSSDDGASWALADPVPGSVSAISADPQRIIVLGTGEGGVAVAWQSPDGDSWQPLPLDGMAIEAHVADIAYDGSAFVAVGSVSVQEGDTPDERAPAAWQSADGETWSVAQLAPIGAANAIHANGSSIIAAGGVSMGGQELSGTAVIWRPSGAAWTAQSLPPSSPPAPAAATGVVANDLGSLVRVNVGGGRGLQIAQELWFIPMMQSGEAKEQGLGIQVSAMASLPDRFVVISNCGETLGTCATSVSIGVGHGGTPAPSLASASASASLPDAQTVIVDAAPDSVVTSLVETDRGLIGVGSTAGAPRVWASEDGRAWSAQEIRSDVVLDDPEWSFALQDVAVGGSGLVAVATGLPTGGAATETSRGAILWSGDGTSWQRVDIPASDRCISLDAVAAGPSSFVAAGHFCDGKSAPAILVSSDGKAWQLADVGEATGGSIADVTTSSDGFVAVGLTSDASGEHPTVWGSDSGASWGVTWADSESAGGMTSVATTPQGLMAGGWLTHPQGEVGVVWTAPNASGWLAPGELTTDCCSSVRSVAAGDGRLRLLLPHTSADGSQLPPPDLLDSADGREWQTNQVPETFSPVKLVITGRHGAFAVGSGISGGNDSIAMLLRLSTVTNPSTPPQTPVPTSSTKLSSAWVATSIAEAGGIQAMVESGPTLSAFGWGDGAATWTSPDGTTWGPEAPIASPDEMDGVVVRTAVWLGPLYVVGGYGGVDQTVPLILTSSDRTHWDLAEIPGAPFCGRINDIVKHGSQLVALGVDCTSEPGRGLILTSHDGAAWTTVEVGFADLDGAELMDGVAIGDESIVVGHVHQPDGTTLGGVWGSAAAKGEGITSLGAGGVWSVTERDGLVVAVGESSANGTSSPAVWTSRGAGFGEWTQVELPDCAQCEGALTSVVAGDDGFFAFGGIGPAGVARSEPIVYHSADGVSWQRQYIAGLNRGLIAGVIATRFGPIAFGSAEAADQTQVPVVVTLNR